MGFFEDKFHAFQQPESLIDKVMAGAIFLGQQTPVAWGDYWAGPNHTLPTAGQMAGVFSLLLTSCHT